MVHLRLEVHLRGLERVVGGELSLRVGGSVREARSSARSGKERVRWPGSGALSLGPLRRLAIDESTPKHGGRGPRRRFVSPAWPAPLFGRGADARDLTRGARGPRPRDAPPSPASRAGDVRTRSDPRSASLGGRGDARGWPRRRGRPGRASQRRPDDGGVPVEDVIVRPRTRRCTTSGGSFWRSCDAEVRGWMTRGRSASVARRRARSGRVEGARLRAGAPSGIFLGVLPSSERARKKIGMARGNPTGAVQSPRGRRSFGRAPAAPW